MIFSHFRVKLLIRKIIEVNIFKGLIYRFYILSLFDFILNFKNTKKICTFKRILNCFEIFSDKSICLKVIPSKILLSTFL